MTTTADSQKALSMFMVCLMTCLEMKRGPAKLERFRQVVP